MKRRSPSSPTLAGAIAGARAPAKFIGLLRGINVGGRNKIPMSELRLLCEEIGWSAVQSYIQSGNLVFSAPAESAALEIDLEKAIDRRFGLSVPVLVRAAAGWSTYGGSNPFHEVSETEPNLVALALSKTPPKADAAIRLRERAADGEQIVQIGDALWIYFKVGVGRSKLSPTLLDRLVGSPVTMRNWRTVLELERLIS